MQFLSRVGVLKKLVSWGLLDSCFSNFVVKPKTPL